MQVKDIMTKTPACCLSDAKLQDAAKMMLDNDCGCIPVIDSEESRKPIGMITDRDITIRTVAEGKNPLDLSVSDTMTKDVVTVTEDTSVQDCCDLMEKHQIRRIAVVDADGACCGMVAQADVALNADKASTAQVVKEVSK